MNFLNFSKIIFILILGLSSTWATRPIKKSVPVTGLYSPEGYDSFENSELVVSGYLPNGCHKSPSVEVNRKSRVIEIRVKALYYKSNFCTEAILPFVKTVSLGVLDSGSYEVRLLEGTSIARSVSFNVSQGSADGGEDQLYANIEHIEKRIEEGKLILYGHNPSDCFVIEEVEVLNNQKNTVTILPKMERVSELCTMQLTPVRYEVTLPIDDEQEATLIHVRTMYGDSLNTLY